MRGRKAKPAEIKKLQGNPGRRPIKEGYKTKTIKKIQPPVGLTKQAIAHYKKEGLYFNTSFNFKAKRYMCYVAHVIFYIVYK